MPLLAEYAITPGVFETTSYSNEEVCGLHLSTIREVMMNEGLVRDLRAGEWRALFQNDGRPWHRRAKEIVKKLYTQRRLIEFPTRLRTPPISDHDWCAEALAGHRQRPLTGGVIVTPPVKDAFPKEPLVERTDRLSRAPWWRQRSASVRLDRKLADYRQHLDPILRCANSLLFIDPHLDPERSDYRAFVDLLVGAGQRSPPPLIEIHRARYVGSGSARSFPAFEPRFRNALAGPLRTAGLRAEVFIWDDFHDRYLLSNLIGVSLPNGFNTTTKHDDRTTWTRLGRTELDDIQREFDRASNRHVLHSRFVLP